MVEKSLILKEAEAIKNWLCTVRRDFHQNPELGMEEFRTQEKITTYLQEMGIEVITGIANTAVVAMIRGKYPGKTVALRGDMDALPIADRKKVSYRSKIEGKMHACGHDAHMTILLGAAKLLKGMEDRIHGTVKLLFQPAEETIGGAKPMIEAGVMENPKVDVVLGLHVTPEIPVGEIGIKYGQMNASSDTIKIVIHGESTHGAYPHGGIDAIVAAGQVIMAAQTITSRNIDPRKSAVVTIGTITGGTQGNIIANKVEMVGTVRSLDPDTRRTVLHRLTEIVEQVTKGLGATGEFIREEGYPALINHDNIVDIVGENGRQLLGENKVKIIKDPSLGVEDFGYFLEESEGAFYRLGCRNQKKGIIHYGHSDLFDIDEDCLSIGVALQVKNALTILGEEDIDEEITGTDSTAY
ncbi:amidohydrolase [Natronincola peptidivorans]|uniref:Amidohydrolase n=1 Tax=Natronincola peptidivorans TaxID=426128 RepID=A0A1I0FZA1_9FIRM|nr:M20 family metallopeptidase [Natronincola peptidivorans]SET63766.1 amidohydrolase [Natronincola peptidivorans]